MLQKLTSTFYFLFVFMLSFVYTFKHEHFELKEYCPYLQVNLTLSGATPASEYGERELS